MSEIKMIAFDLDGTLLTADKQVTEYTREVLRQAGERGIEIIPATGRPLRGVPNVLLEMPEVHYVVTSNGARVLEKSSGKAVWGRVIPQETAKEVMQILNQYDVLCDLYYDGVGYSEQKHLERIREYCKDPAIVAYILSTREVVDSLPAMLLDRKQGTEKVHALFRDAEKIPEAWEQLMQIDGIEVSGSLSNNIEINAAGVDKGNALLELGEILGVGREGILAFGDGLNDLQMLKKVGTGVAMRNAVAELLEQADDVTRTNDEDGVAWYIEQQILNHTL